MAALPIFNSQDKDLSMLQTRWASLLNPILSNPLARVYILKDIALVPGLNVINHLQGRPLQGYIVIGMRGGFSEIYDAPSDMPKLTLILNSSAVTTVDLMVF